jgi:hypothetical protein
MLYLSGSHNDEALAESIRWFIRHLLAARVDYSLDMVLEVFPNRQSIAVL